MRETSVVRSSVIPSAKYSCSGSLLRLAKGSTTIERRGAENGCIGDETADTSGPAWRLDHSHHPPAPAAITIAAAATATMRLRTEAPPARKAATTGRRSDTRATL